MLELQFTIENIHWKDYAGEAEGMNAAVKWRTRSNEMGTTFPCVINHKGVGRWDQSFSVAYTSQSKLLIELMMHSDTGEVESNGSVPIDLSRIAGLVGVKRHFLEFETQTVNYLTAVVQLILSTRKLATQQLTTTNGVTAQWGTINPTQELIACSIGALYFPFEEYRPKSARGNRHRAVHLVNILTLYNNSDSKVNVTLKRTTDSIKFQPKKITLSPSAVFHIVVTYEEPKAGQKERKTGSAPKVLIQAAKQGSEIIESVKLDVVFYSPPNAKRLKDQTRQAAETATRATIQALLQGEDVLPATAPVTLLTTPRQPLSEALQPLPVETPSSSTTTLPPAEQPSSSGTFGVSPRTNPGQGTPKTNTSGASTPSSCVSFPTTPRQPAEAQGLETPRRFDKKGYHYWVGKQCYTSLLLTPEDIIQIHKILPQFNKALLIKNLDTGQIIEAEEVTEQLPKYTLAPPSQFTPHAHLAVGWGQPRNSSESSNNDHNKPNTISPTISPLALPFAQEHPQVGQMTTVYTLTLNDFRLLGLNYTPDVILQQQILKNTVLGHHSPKEEPSYSVIFRPLTTSWSADPIQTSKRKVNARDGIIGWAEPVQLSYTGRHGSGLPKVSEVEIQLLEHVRFDRQVTIGSCIIDVCKFQELCKLNFLEQQQGSSSKMTPRGGGGSLVIGANSGSGSGTHWNTDKEGSSDEQFMCNSNLMFFINNQYSRYHLLNCPNAMLNFVLEINNASRMVVTHTPRPTHGGSAPNGLPLAIVTQHLPVCNTSHPPRNSSEFSKNNPSGSSSCNSGSVAGPSSSSSVQREEFISSALVKIMDDED